MTNILENICLKVPDVLVPPVLVLRRPVLPVPDLELAELGGQVHESDGDHLRLPLQAQGGAQTVIDKSPGHLNHLLQFRFVSFQTLCIFQN